MSTEEEPLIEEVKKEFETWDSIKKEVNSTKEFIRTPGNHRYKLKANIINGDQYEDVTLSALDAAGGRNMKFNKKISSDLKKLILVEVAGQDYKPIMDREMPPWMKEDLEQFIKEFISGEL